MANRTAYGLTHSSNGWPMVDQGSCTWAQIPGADVTLQIQNGWPLAILRAFAADFNAYIEPLRDADSACWTATNSVASSNHLSGTAMDLNWNSHPFQVADAGFDAAKVQRMRALLAFYEGMVFWGNDWSSPKDAMHFQLASLANGGNIDTYGNPAVGDFIARRIRADGYSTYQRGAVSVPPKSPQSPDAVTVLAQAAGLPASRAAEIVDQVRAGLTASQCTTPRRIAYWLAQIGHESDGFNATEEYAKNGRYAPYIGRTWVQITWDYNYRAFSAWCYGRGLVPTATYFVDRPAELALLKWAGLGPAWYWTEARPNINALCDAGDFVGVTRAINGGTNGLADRQARLARAEQLGDRLLTLTTAPVPTDPIEELLMSDLRVPSLSIYADPGEQPPLLIDMIRALDAHGPHEPYTEAQARAGDVDSIRRVARTAAGRGQYGTAARPVAQATAVLADIEATHPEYLANAIQQIGA